MKINIKNYKKLRETLDDVNGAAKAHTYDAIELMPAFNLVQSLARDAERELTELGIPKSEWVGAVYESTSGDKVSNAYASKGHHRVATAVTIERFPSGWFLTHAEKTTAYQQGGSSHLFLTLAQADFALAHARAKFSLREDY